MKALKYSFSIRHRKTKTKKESKIENDNDVWSPGRNKLRSKAHTHTYIVDLEEVDEVTKTRRQIACRAVVHRHLVLVEDCREEE